MTARISLRLPRSSGTTLGLPPHGGALVGDGADAISDPPLSLGNVDVVVADDSDAHHNVYLDAEGRFVAIGMPKS